jgi:hypothetical protein
VTASAGTAQRCHAFVGMGNLPPFVSPPARGPPSPHRFDVRPAVWRMQNGPAPPRPSLRRTQATVVIPAIVRIFPRRKVQPDVNRIQAPPDPADAQCHLREGRSSEQQHTGRHRNTGDPTLYHALSPIALGAVVQQTKPRACPCEHAQISACSSGVTSAVCSGSMVCGKFAGE